LRNEESLLASVIGLDLVIPSSAESVGIVLETGVGLTRSGRWDMGLEVFRRTQRGAPTARLGTDPVEDPIFFAPTTATEGRDLAHGLTATLSTLRADYALRASLSVTRVRRAFDAVEYTPRLGSGVEVNLGTVRQLGRSAIRLSGTVRSGIRYTGVAGVTQLPAYPDGSDLANLGLTRDFNGVRSPYYARIDVGWEAQYQISIAGRDVGVSPYLTLVNVLNRENAIRVEVPATGAPRVSYGQQLPVLPFVGVTWRF